MKNNYNLSLIIPCFNEETNIDELIERLNKTLKKLKNIVYELIFIDDGSTDKTYSKLSEKVDHDNKIKIIKLSRNFGQHISISAGLDHVSEPDCCIIIPADLQEPPEKIPEMIKKWSQNNEIVWAIRKKRKQNIISKFFSKFFYFIFIKSTGFKNYPKEGPSSFFLIDKKIVSNWKNFKEKNRMILGMIAWMGFSQSKIYYNQSIRKNGISGFNFFSLLKLAIDSIISFSYVPIRLVSVLGIITSLVGFFYSFYLIFSYFFLLKPILGWTSIMVVVLILGGLQLVTLGILGEYIWRNLDESRARPLYLISDKKNIK